MFKLFPPGDSQELSPTISQFSNHGNSYYLGYWDTLYYCGYTPLYVDHDKDGLCSKIDTAINLEFELSPTLDDTSVKSTADES